MLISYLNFYLTVFQYFKYINPLLTAGFQGEKFTLYLFIFLKLTAICVFIN